MIYIPPFAKTPAEKLSSPKGSVVLVFVALTPWTQGYPRLDSAIRCVDPFTTSMKYLDHMQSRGWVPTEVSHMVDKVVGCHAVTLVLEKVEGVVLTLHD